MGIKRNGEVAGMCDMYGRYIHAVHICIAPGNLYCSMQRPHICRFLEDSCTNMSGDTCISYYAMETLIRKDKDAVKLLVVTCCVFQGKKDLKDLEGVSIIGVQQIEMVVEVVEETLKGHEVRLLRRNSLPSLDLPKVRAIIDSPPYQLFL